MPRSGDFFAEVFATEWRTGGCVPCARSNMRATLAKAHACELVPMAAIGYGTWWGTGGFATRSAPTGVHLHYRAHPSSRHGAGTAPDLGGLHFDSSPETRAAGRVPCQLCCSTPRAPTHRYLPAVGAAPFFSPSHRARKAGLKCWFSNLSSRTRSHSTACLALPRLAFQRISDSQAGLLSPFGRVALRLGVPASRFASRVGGERHCAVT